ncbi:hypothetical protein EVAR_44214_1 [Eumeta japonica]|uniref:Uncharacterized protein n=1 Tax=Eumeta variegata TaxID=151549 RepID=A0A4C1VZK7_EUMVA|nr:hypothetical protein EVAR_44214_1 [Eumeta japonica]
MRLINDHPFYKMSNISGPAPPHKPNVVLGSIPAAMVESFQSCHPFGDRVSLNDQHYRSISKISKNVVEEPLFLLKKLYEQVEDGQH